MQALWRGDVPVARRVCGLAASAGLALGALLLLAASAQAAAPRAPANLPAVNIVVNTHVDAPDTNATDTNCHIAGGGCSLRAALQTLNSHNGGSITLSAGHYVLTDTADGDLQMQKDIQILANNPSTFVIEGEPGWTHRILRVQDGAQVQISDVTISGGNVLNGNGGGIDVVSGTLTITNVFVMNNQGGNGSGLYNSGRLNVGSTLIEHNTAITNGGGLYNAPGGSLNVAYTVLSSDTAGGSGGGLYNLGVASVLTSTANDNHASGGGGIADLSGGSLTIRDSTLDFNVASAHDGGGLFVSDLNSVADVINSTVSGNQAEVHGGGVDERNGGTTYLSSVTVVSNTALGKGGGLSLFEPTTGQQPSGEEFRLRNSLVALNADNGSAPDCDGVFDSQGYNLVQNMLGCQLLVVTTGNVTGQNAKLLPLGFYGGLTEVWGLEINSPAIDGGNPAGCRDNHNQLLLNDQRGDGYPRAVDGNGDGTARCDIGAFELELFQKEFLPLMMR